MQTPFGLIGRKLGHSWSRQIHEELGSTPYSLLELEPEDVAGFVREGAWRGINVTIPYKADAAAAADERSPRVERLGVANTLVRRPDGTIYAENTDVLGFAWMLERFCRRELGGSANEVLLGKKCLVLGSGGPRGRGGGCGGRLARGRGQLRQPPRAARGRLPCGQHNPRGHVSLLPRHTCGRKGPWAHGRASWRARRRLQPEPHRHLPCGREPWATFGVRPRHARGPGVLRKRALPGKEARRGLDRAD